jgi:acetyl esterase/lipase
MATLAMTVVASVTAFTISPWPSALALRWMFERDGHAANAALSAYVPAGIRTSANVRYDPSDSRALLNIYRPSALDGHRLPVIVWIHGGGYVGGSRGAVANYARILAADGYAVIAVDYPLAPGAHYPEPVRQLSRALRFLSEHAEQLKLDSSRFILGGDSGGAQLASQLAALASSRDYAQVTGLNAGISISQLRGVVLFCGPHDGRLTALKGKLSWFVRIVMWSYLGSTSPSDATVQAFSVVPHVSSTFPPAFISVGNGDPLAPQSFALADALRRHGVRAETLFYPASHDPSLPHEYQFNLSLPEAREALSRTRAFLRDLIQNGRD